MIQRYARSEMADIWRDESRFDLMLQVELKVCEAQAELGRIPRRDLGIIKRRASFAIKRIAEIEEKAKHDVVAFLAAISEKVGPSSRYIHMGMTSSDVLDTALAIQLKKASDIIIDDIGQLLKVLKKKALKYKYTPMIGRSHGIHAEPITFGLKMAYAYQEFVRNLHRMRTAKETISVGKISGAVGTYAYISPRVEAKALRKLGLRREEVSTQIVPRDRHAHFFSTLALIASSIERLAVEIRHLERTEVAEVAEPFTKGQKGSSAMPHKRNPILSENLTGLARVVRTYAQAAMEDVALWHERDISHSSVERIIGPDATTLIDFMLARLTHVIEGLEVYPEQMLLNIEKTGGLIFSQHVLLKLLDKCVTREAAYKLVQRNAMKVLRTGGSFKDMLFRDKEVSKYISSGELDALFDVGPHLKHIDHIFERVFG